MRSLLRNFYRSRDEREALDRVTSPYVSVKDTTGSKPMDSRR